MTGDLDHLMLLIEPLFKLGEALLKGYGKANDIQSKEDLSPLTGMDLWSDQFLAEQLKAISPYPILSEEKNVPFEDRRFWERFWMIDPLDGTKAYIKGQGDFTVNIALIEKRRPIEAFILSPIQDKIYYAKRGSGTHLISRNNTRSKLMQIKRRQPALFRSYSHEGEEMEKFLMMNPYMEDIPLSSAIKFCHVATNDPSCYLRFAGSSEWDIAAGDLIVSESGGIMIDTKYRQPVQYNSEALRSPSFFAISNSSLLGEILWNI